MNDSHSPLRLGQFLACLLLVATALPAHAVEFQFIHPGLLHSQADLERMKAAVADKQEPIYAGYQQLIAHPNSRLDYRIRGPLDAVGRSVNGAGGQGVYDNDATAAYHFALIWAITGDRAYADRAKEILNAWSSTLRLVNGRDGVLMGGLGPFKMVNAAEIMRHTNSGWSEAEAQQAERCFMHAVYPTIKDFALFANGNWDTAAMKTVIAIGVYCNDRAIFESGMRYYVAGAGNGCLTNYIINEQGQCQESGRDAAHSQLGIGHLGDCAEVAWNQGLDLYSLADNRLLKGFEYAATHHLGGEVPFEPMLDRTGKYPWSRIAARGPLRPIYEQIYRHYVSRMSVDSPMLKAAVDRVRPEGPSRPIGDHPGYGTLLFARLSSTPPKNQQPPTKSPASPSAVIAKGSAAGVDLAWVTSHNASSYVVKRAISSGGPYAAIAKDVPTPAYVDESVEPGTLYYYVVSAANAIGESADSFETGITAGMPGPWKNQDIGDVKLAGWASFDGRSFSVSGAGRNIGGALRDAVGSNDQFHFVYLPLRGDGTITARFVPPMSGMRSKFGLMMRESLSTDSPHVALLIEPSGSNRESPGYSAKFVNRPTAGAAMSEFGQHRVPEPFVSEGRFMEPYWIRLSRTGNTFAAFASIDGDRWVQVARSNDGNNSSVLGGRRGQGSAPSGTMELALNENLFVGIPVCSTILQTVGDTEIAVDTVIKMDNVVATGWTPPPNGRNEE